jgi:hypothetical protein
LYTFAVDLFAFTQRNLIGNRHTGHHQASYAIGQGINQAERSVLNLYLNFR